MWKLKEFTLKYREINTFFVSAGLNGTASLFQIDGKSNPKMQSVHFENFPIKTAHFTSDGKQFLVGSQHFGHFFAYDMVKGMYILNDTV